MTNTDEETITVVNEQCPTCTRSKYDPFRRHDERGKVTIGCIDDFHTGHLVSPSESNSWHNHRDAKRWRAAVKKHTKLIMGKAIHDYRNCQCFSYRRT
jgi:hypothetical protein